MAEMRSPDLFSKLEYWVIRFVLFALVVGGAFKVLNSEFHLTHFFKVLLGY